MMDVAFEQKIRQRAYEIWVAAGMEDGDAESHWLHAERSVLHETRSPAAEPFAGGAPAPARPDAKTSGTSKTPRSRGKSATAKSVISKSATAKSATAKPSSTKTKTATAKASASRMATRTAAMGDAAAPH